MAANPIVSVIVPTFNRRKLLRDLLESLGRQGASPECFEILIMDNGSSDGTSAEIADFQASHPDLDVRFHVMEENRGPAISRNRGAQLARGEILFFTDSDVFVREDWIERGLAVFTGDPELAMVSGPTVDKPNQRHSFFSVGTSNLYLENPIYPTSNVIYRKPVFEAAGGFDQATCYGDCAGVPLECSDVDLAWKVIGEGGRTRFLPELVVYHEVRVEPLLRWMATQLRVLYIPMIVRRHPATRKSFLWYGPFAAPENFLFYIALASVVLAGAARSPWWLLGLVPLFARFGPFLKPSWSPLRWPKLAAQLGMVFVRQSLICGALLYGSIRSRRVVL